MTFHTLLRQTNFDWEVAKRVFYNLTPLQVGWINLMNTFKGKSKDITFGNGKPGFEVVKTFDLRRRRR